MKIGLVQHPAVDIIKENLEYIKHFFLKNIFYQLNPVR